MYQNSLPKITISKFLSLPQVDRGFGALIAILFFIVALTGAYHHEPWRDEIQAWLLAIHAHSFSQLYENCRYEGHPILWHLLLFGISRFSIHIFYMQALSVVIVSATVYLFCAYSPFSRLQKALFSFGFFPLYEYCIIARSYSLLLLLVFIFIVIYSEKGAAIESWIALFLIANVSATGVILSCCFAALSVYSTWAEKNRYDMQKTVRETVPGALLFLTGLVLSVWQIWPEQDNNYEGAFTGHDILVAASRLYDSYRFTSHMPDILFLNELQLKIATSVILFLFVCLLLMDKPAALLFYISAIICMVIFFGITKMFAVRFAGHYYLALVVSFWISRKFHTRPGTTATPMNSYFRREKIIPVFLTIVLVCQCIRGLAVFRADYLRPFSAGKQVASYLAGNRYDRLPVIGTADYAVSPLAYWLHKPVFYPEIQAYGTYITWNTRRQLPASRQLLLASLQTVMQENSKAIIVLSIPVTMGDTAIQTMIEKDQWPEEFRITLLKKFENSLLPDETYYVYLAQQKNLNR